MAEQDEVDFKKLPLDERAVHKNWRARFSAYEELIKIFNEIDDDKSPEWNKWASLVRKFPTDSNPAALEKGLEALLIFIENCAVHGPKMVGEIISSLITKCINSGRTKTRELATSLILMCIEIEKYEIVQEQLLKGMEGKNPKQVAACVALVAQSLREFGVKVLNLKPIMKKIPVLLEDRDKSIRDETKKLVVELFKWIGPGFKSQLSSLKQVMLTELDAEFDKVGREKPIVTRYLKSQQNKKERLARDGGTEAEVEYQPDQSTSVMDPSELLEPEDILSKLPKDFYEKCESKKWQERKEALEELDGLLTKYSVLEAGDYGDLVRNIKRMIIKDSNVVVVALAGKCLTGLANGLQKKFSPYASSCIQTIVEKFKEKKPNVLAAMKDAADACFVATNLEQIQEIAIQALQSKNPTIKTEIGLFLGRSFHKTSYKTMTDKKFMKPYITALLVNLNDSDAGVRDAAAEALGVCMKATGEKFMSSFLSELDPIKMQKIKEFAGKTIGTDSKEKVAIKTSSSKFLPPIPKSAPPKAAADTPLKPSTSSLSSKKPISNTGNKGFRANPNISVNEDEGSTLVTPHLSPAAKIVGSPSSRIDILNQLNDGLLEKLVDKNWNIRSDALDQISNIVLKAQHILPNLGELPSIICQRLQDTNRNIAANSFLFCQNLARALGPHCKQYVRSLRLLSNMLNGLGDTRTNVRCTVVACLNAWADQAGLEEFFRGEIIADALKSSSPLLRSELLNWLAVGLPQVRNINKGDMSAALPCLLSCMEDRNVEVRKAAQDCVMPFMIHLGYETMSRACANLKPASKAALQKCLDKAKAKASEKSATKGKTSTTSLKVGTPQSAMANKNGESENSNMETPQSLVASGQIGGDDVCKLPLKNFVGPLSNTSEEIYGNSKLFSKSLAGEIGEYKEPGCRQEQEVGECFGTCSTYFYDKNGNPGIMQEPKAGPSVLSYLNNQSSLPANSLIDFEEIDSIIETKYLKPLTELKLYDLDTAFLDNDPSISLPVKRPTAMATKTQVPGNNVHSIELHISSLNSENLMESFDACTQLESIVTDSLVDPVLKHVLNREVLCPKMDTLISAVSKQIGRLLSLVKDHQPDHVGTINKNFHGISALLKGVYRNEELGKYVSSSCLKELIHHCLCIIAEPAMTCVPEHDKIVKHFNVLVIQIIEKSDPNAAICAGIRLITDTVSPNNETTLRLAKLALKCQWKLLKQLGIWHQESSESGYQFTIPAFITEFYNFLQTHPSESFATHGCDSTSLKTIKTFIHTLVIKLGARKVHVVLSQMDSTIQNSEAGNYMKKLIFHGLQSHTPGPLEQQHQLD